MRFLIIFLFLPFILPAQVNKDSLEFEKLLPAYIQRCDELDAPKFKAEYLKFIPQISSLERVKKVSTELSVFGEKLEKIKRYKLNETQQTHYDLMRLHLESIMGYCNLRMDMLNGEMDENQGSTSQAETKEEPLSPEGLAHITLGKEWYGLYLNYYYGSPGLGMEKLKVYGVSLSAMRGQQVEKIIEESSYKGNPRAFFDYLKSAKNKIRDPEKLKEEAQNRADQVVLRARHLFGIEVPDIRIELDGKAPWGQMEDNVLHLYFPEEGFPKSDLDYVILYQVAGHHVINQIKPLPAIWKGKCTDRAFREGWSLYVTRLGRQFQLYSDPYAQAAARMHQKERSVMVRLDYGVHAEAWNASDCKEYWDKELPWLKGQYARIDSIIARPGYYSIPAWTEFEIDSKLVGSRIIWDRSIKGPEFYSTLLRYGSMPPALVFDRIDREFSRQ